MTQDTEIHYIVKCRMGVDSDWYHMGSATNEEELKALIDHLKTTWRYVYPIGYRARTVAEQPSKRKKK